MAIEKNGPKEARAFQEGFLKFLRKGGETGRRIASNQKWLLAGMGSTAISSLLLLRPLDKHDKLDIYIGGGLLVVAVSCLVKCGRSIYKTRRDLAELSAIGKELIQQGEQLKRRITEESREDRN